MLPGVICRGARDRHGPGRSRGVWSAKGSLRVRKVLYHVTHRTKLVMVLLLANDTSALSCAPKLSVEQRRYSSNAVPGGTGIVQAAATAVVLIPRDAASIFAWYCFLLNRRMSVRFGQESSRTTQHASKINACIAPSLPPYCFQGGGKPSGNRSGQEQHRVSRSLFPRFFILIIIMLKKKITAGVHWLVAHPLFYVGGEKDVSWTRRSTVAACERLLVICFSTVVGAAYMYAPGPRRYSCVLFCTLF